MTRAISDFVTHFAMTPDPAELLGLHARSWQRQELDAVNALREAVRCG